MLTGSIGGSNNGMDLSQQSYNASHVGRKRDGSAAAMSTLRASRTPQLWIIGKKDYM
jgi:hypothetical protein